MKVAITGGAGFVGRYVVEQLRVEGHTVEALDISQYGLEGSSRVDVTNIHEIKGALKGFAPDVVAHLAALAGSTGKGGGAESLKDPYQYFNVNFNGTLNVYEACRQLKISKVICMSSFSPYGRAPCPITEDTPLHPNSPYGSSKACVEEIAKCYALNYGIQSVIFRPPLICGEGQMEVNALREFVACALADAPIVILGKGKHVREFVHPSDVARALSSGIVYVCSMSSPYEIFVLGNGAISMVDLAKLVTRKVGKGSIVFKEATNQSFDQFTDHSKAKKLLDWTPRISVEEIVNRVIYDIEARQSRQLLQIKGVVR